MEKYFFVYVCFSSWDSAHYKIRPKVYKSLKAAKIAAGKLQANNYPSGVYYLACEQKHLPFELGKAATELKN
jgi:hypothetical protein